MFLNLLYNIQEAKWMSESLEILFLDKSELIQQNFTDVKLVFPTKKNVCFILLKQYLFLI